MSKVVNEGTPSVSDRDDQTPAPITFPLVGEWFAAATPSEKVPSHGTDMLGQRYAYDFVHALDIELAASFWGGLQYWP